MIFSDRVAFGFLACNFATYIWVWVAVYYVLHAVMSVSGYAFFTHEMYETEFDLELFILFSITTAGLTTSSEDLSIADNMALIMYLLKAHEMQRKN